MLAMILCFGTCNDAVAQGSQALSQKEYNPLQIMKDNGQAEDIRYLPGTGIQENARCSDPGQNLIFPLRNMLMKISLYRISFVLVLSMHNFSAAQPSQPSVDREYKPLQLMKDHAQGDAVLYFSMLSAYDGEAGSRTFPYVTSFRWATDEETKARRGKVEVLGGSLRLLYYLAYGDTLWNAPSDRVPSTSAFPDTIRYPHQKRSYGKYWYRPVLEIRDTAVFESHPKNKQHRFNYTLQVPPEKATASVLQGIMQQDLNQYFDYVVSVEERMMPCWRLTVSQEGKKKLKTKTPGQKYRSTTDAQGNYARKNALVRDIIFQLEYRYGYSATENQLTYRADRQPPFVDATGIIGEIDYTYDRDIIDKINDERKVRNTFEDYRRVLEGFGFSLERGYKKMKVVVIRDKT